MRNGQLQDGDVAVLSRQAVDMLAEDIEIRIDPIPGADPYRWGTGAWIVRPALDTVHPLSIRIESHWTPVRALAFLMQRLAEFAADTNFYWGVPYPVCPGHQHPARIDAEDAEVVRLRCPDTGDVVGLVRPDI